MTDLIKDELLNSFVVGEMDASTYKHWVDIIAKELKQSSNEQIVVQWSKTPVLQIIEYIWAEQGITVQLMFDTESQTTYLIVGNVLYQNDEMFRYLADINGLIVERSKSLGDEWLSKIVLD